LSAAIILCFLSSNLAAYSQAVKPIPAASPYFLTTSSNFEPALLKGMKVDPSDPLKFYFILDTGNSGKVTSQQIKTESEKLARYFLAAIAIPRKDLWVNLSPYEKERIIADTTAQTDLGETLLGQDYLLKRLAASLTYPETKAGKKYWNDIQGRGGSRTAPTNNYNKVWIMPDYAEVYQEGNGVFITKSRLKVLMEEDYLARGHTEGGTLRALAIQKNGVGARSPRPGRGNPAPTNTDAFRQHILPLIEKEVNEGKNFAPLRQIYHSLILALWYKENLKNTILNRQYFDKSNVKGIALNDKTAKEKIYAQYLEVFKKGAYNYVKRESVGTRFIASARITKRQYFSGGFTAGEAEFIRPGAPQLFRPVGHGEVVTIGTKNKIVPAVVTTEAPPVKRIIEGFTANERAIFQRAQSIQGLTIGFDLEQVISTSQEDLQKGGLADQMRERGVDISELRSRLTRPGMIALILGLAAHNKLKIVTAAYKSYAQEWIQGIPVLKELVDLNVIELVTAETVEETAKKVFKIEAWGEYFLINGVVLDREESTGAQGVIDSFRRIPFWRALKSPRALGLDVLIEDRATLKPIMEKTGQGAVIIVPPYMLAHLVRPDARGVSVVKTFLADANKGPAIAIEDQAGYDAAVPQLESLLDDLGKIHRADAGQGREIDVDYVAKSKYVLPMKVGKVYYFRDSDKKGFVAKYGMVSVVAKEMFAYDVARFIGVNTPWAKTLDGELARALNAKIDLDEKPNNEPEAALILQPLDEMTGQDLRQPDSSGLEEAVIFVHLMLDIDISVTKKKNIFFKDIGGKRRCVLFDFATLEYSQKLDDIGGEDDSILAAWVREILELDPERLVGVLNRIQQKKVEFEELLTQHRQVLAPQAAPQLRILFDSLEDRILNSLKRVSQMQKLMDSLGPKQRERVRQTIDVLSQHAAQQSLNKGGVDLTHDFSLSAKNKSSGITAVPGQVASDISVDQITPVMIEAKDFIDLESFFKPTR